MSGTDDQEEKQKRFQIAQPIGTGVDENGEYEIIPLSMMLGGKLKPYKVYLKPMKHIINDSNPNPRGWYKGKHETGRRRIRPCYTEAIITTPYSGYCHVGCRFCYIDGGSRGYKATGIPTVSPSYPEHMRKQIGKMMTCPGFYISPYTEPFQLLEEKYEVVHRLTDVIVENGLPFYYLSRRIPPDWAVDALQQNPYSYMQWSINSSNTEIYKKMSPGSYTIEEVMDKIQELHNKGIYISIQIDPILPGIVDLDDIVKLVHLISENGGDHVIFKIMEQVTGNRKMLFERLRAGKLEGVDTLESLLTQIIGGVCNVRQDVRVDWWNVLLEETRKVGITMSLCFEYFDDGKAGANLAPYFTTADQCHGRGVPMYFRPELEAPFQPLAGCYRKGCLWCEEYGTHACKSETLLEAKALKYSDYKAIKLTSDTQNWNLVDSCLKPSKVKKGNGANPGLATDAELWGWKTDND